MRKMKEVAPFLQAKFLLALADGRSRGFIDVARMMDVMLEPTTQMFIDSIAKPLWERGLIKFTWRGYQITDAGRAWLQGEGAQLVALLSHDKDRRSGGTR